MADEDLRSLERKWQSTGSLEDLQTFDRAARRAGLFGPAIARAMNEAAELATSLTIVDCRPLRERWRQRRIPSIWVKPQEGEEPSQMIGQSLVQDMPNIYVLLRRWQTVHWSENADSDRNGYPIGYEFSYILDVLLHAKQHGFHFNPAQIRMIELLIEEFFGKHDQVILCNAERRNRRDGRALPACRALALDCSCTCRCVYGEDTLDVCAMCGRRASACVCDQFYDWQIGSDGFGALVITLHPEADLCSCRGSGWAHSDADSSHTCRFHYNGQPHPEEYGYEPPPSSPPSQQLPPTPSSPESDDLPF